MAKVTLTDLTGGFGSVDALNANFTAIETAMENTLSRNGTSPNTMTANLDMNGYAILNALATAGDINFIWKGNWTTATAYVQNNLVYVPIGTGSSYDGYTLICLVDHTSGTLNTDYTAAKWSNLAARGATGASGTGSGDLVSTNNLSDLANAATARTNLGLAIGTNVQAYDAELAALAGLTSAANKVPMFSGSGAATLLDFKDEDAMTSDSATAVPSQQSVKAYVLANAGGGVAGETTYNVNTTLSVSTDNKYLIRCTIASVVYTFPAATGNEGKYWWITNQTATDTAVRLVANGSESIGGATGSTIYIPAYTTIGFVSDNANWLVFYSDSMFWEFNANGTWYCPPGVYEIEVDGSGGGGGGGGTGAAVCGAGGGSGAVCIKKKVTVVPGTQYTVTIGPGGAAKAAGSATSLGAVLTLAGGGAGTDGSTGGVAGAGGMDGQSAPSGGAGIGGIGGLGGFGGTTTAISGAAGKANTGGGGGGGFSDGTNGSGAGAGGSGYLRIRA